MTLYPDGIDSNLNLPTVPGSDGYIASINAIQAAVIAIEAELGIDPHGAYSDVTTRLSILESRVGPGPGISGTIDINNANLTGILNIARGGTALNAAGATNTVLTSAGSTLLYKFLTNSNIATGAAIDGSKINPNFGNQNITVAGSDGGITATAGIIQLPTDSFVASRSSNNTKNLQVFSTSSWINHPFNSPSGLQEILSVGSDWNTFNSLKSFDVTSISANNYVIITTTNVSGFNNILVDDYQTGIAPNGSFRIGSGASTTLFNWDDYGDGYGVMRFGDSGTPPTANASSGVIVYSSASGLNVNGSYLAVRPDVATPVATEGTIRSSIESASFVRNTADTNNLGVYATSTFGFNPIFGHDQDGLVVGTDENGTVAKTFDVTSIYANDFISLSTTALNSGMTVEANQTLVNARTNFGVCGNDFGPITASSTFGDGYGIMYLGDAYVVPTNNPPTGVLFYAEGGIAKVRQSDGTIIPIVAGGGSFTAAGDLSGDGTTQTVIGIQGRPVNPNNVSPNDIADGMVLTYDLGSSEWIGKMPTGGFTANGDLTGSSTSQSVVGISGDGINPVLIVATALDWLFNVVDPTLSVLDATSGDGSTLHIKAQSTNFGIGGILSLEGGAGSGITAGGNVEISMGIGVPNGDFKLNNVKTSATIGADGGAAALTATPVGYIKIYVNGTEYQVPYYNT